MQQDLSIHPRQKKALQKAGRDLRDEEVSASKGGLQIRLAFSDNFKQLAEQLIQLALSSLGHLTRWY